MLVLFRRGCRNAALAGLLASVLFCSPLAVLRLLLTLRAPVGALAGGPCVDAKLRLQRKAPSFPVEVPRPLVLWKSDVARWPVPFDRVVSAEGCSSGGELIRPDVRRFILPSSPQNPVYPPKDPDPVRA